VAVPGLLPEIAAARKRGVPAVGVSGLVGGRALRGPADRMLAALGEEATSVGVARRYAAIGLIDAFVLDTADEELAPDVDALGIAAVVANTIMSDAAARASVARVVLAAAGSVVSRRRRPAAR